MYSTEIKAYTQLTPQIVQQLSKLTLSIPELNNPQTAAELEQKLINKNILILIAYVEGEMAGFKLGYAQSEQTFYSWLGGVHPDFRKLGLAKSMLAFQENWAMQQNYHTMTVKTHNHFNAMLNLLVNQKYHITAVIEASEVPNHKLHLQKQL
ncbi:GNAT family N-acetyltransferase [Shewanella intestini]|uniref:GNAT family N-acetyltransferase n=1 Tax=Shewanella intestini TaxID=2017544 RepID=A0ABS5I489_9GAMM|nr:MULTISPECIES: GNAT family N-acetyltransferase [Shewanella]MBR9728643.1 GNAT family N-acetyltransferase [Shewanella intestini]MRG37301.1 GNAT family N-acetyltransferase [Shewanella sp. XMDDZSB0408]